MDIELVYFSLFVVLEKVQFFQNELNLFVRWIKVWFFLFEKMQVSLCFIDFNGKLLKVICDEFFVGENEIILECGIFKGYGIIYYILIVGLDMQILKMI